MPLIYSVQWVHKGSKASCSFGPRGAELSFRSSSSKRKNVPWHSTLHLTVSEYLIPLSRMYTAFSHKWSQWKSSDMIHAVYRQLSVWEGSAMHNVLRWMNTILLTYRKRQCVVIWIAPRLYRLHCPSLHWVKEFRYHNDTTVWSWIPPHGSAEPR